MISIYLFVKVISNMVVNIISAFLPHKEYLTFDTYVVVSSSIVADACVPPELIDTERA